jgi:hypothetical protein
MMGLHNLYASPNIIRTIKSRRMRWAGHAARMGEMINAYEILGGKPEGESPSGKPWCRWVDNRVDFKGIRWKVVDWIHLAQDRGKWRAAVKTVMKLRVPQKAGNFLTS